MTEMMNKVNLSQYRAWLRESPHDLYGKDPGATTQHILRFWDTNKENLYHLLGDNLSISKPISYKHDRSELQNKMRDMLSKNYYFVQTFLHELRTKLDDTGLMIFDSKNPYYDIENMLHAYSLVEGHVSEIIRPYDFMLNGHRITINPGQKIMKTLGSIAKALDLQKDFEQFRIAQSQVMNVGKLTGELCLSIEPLDFCTASDNENGWTSCMSWTSGNGCYRFGTIEMMNSAYVLCAYLKSDTAEMSIGNEPWPSKKWRAWIIVHPEFILVQRNYPYTNEYLCRACVEWVRELSEQNLGIKYEGKIDKQDPVRRMNISTNLMYNDTSDEHIMCYRDDSSTEDIPSDHENLNISGPAVCINCGDVIGLAHIDDDMADGLTCWNCREDDAIYCCECGDRIDEDNIYTDSNDNQYCYDCYHELFATCDCCDEYSPCEEVHNFKWFAPNNKVLSKALDDYRTRTHQLNLNSRIINSVEAAVIYSGYTWEEVVDKLIAFTYTQEAARICTTCLNYTFSYHWSDYISEYSRAATTTFTQTYFNTLSKEFGERTSSCSAYFTNHYFVDPNKVTMREACELFINSTIHPGFGHDIHDPKMWELFEECFTPVWESYRTWYNTECANGNLTY